jgi:uncharacterized membrane protein YbhN (UPF0104 family)
MKLSSNTKSTLVMLFKILFASAILYWLISQNKLDFSLVKLSFAYPITWFSCFFISIFQIYLASFRLRMILKLKISSLTVFKMMSIHWIGLFFSVVLPGGIAGDLVKIGYVKSVQENIGKKFLLLSIFIDRLAGLTSLLLLAGFTSAIYYNDLIALNPLLKNIIYINIILCIASACALSLFFINKSLQNKILRFISIKKLTDALEMLWTLSSHKKVIFKALTISAIGHILVITGFWIINTPFFEHPIEFKYLFSLIPLGLVAVALPISPAGLGVGHVAFESLFSFIGHSNGASLFNVFWVVNFLVNICGFIPFILSKSTNGDKV